MANRHRQLDSGMNSLLADFGDGVVETFADIRMWSVLFD